MISMRKWSWIRLVAVIAAVILIVFGGVESFWRTIRFGAEKFWQS
jgi:hypothetical protein